MRGKWRGVGVDQRRLIQEAMRRSICRIAEPRVASGEIGTDVANPVGRGVVRAGDLKILDRLDAQAFQRFAQQLAAIVNGPPDSDTRRQWSPCPSSAANTRSMSTLMRWR